MFHLFVLFMFVDCCFRTRVSLWTSLSSLKTKTFLCSTLLTSSTRRLNRSKSKYDFSSVNAYYSSFLSILLLLPLLSLTVVYFGRSMRLQTTSRGSIAKARRRTRRARLPSRSLKTSSSQSLKLRQALNSSTRSPPTSLGSSSRVWTRSSQAVCVRVRC